jgi:hypothetical protein
LQRRLHVGAATAPTRRTDLRAEQPLDGGLLSRSSEHGGNDRIDGRASGNRILEIERRLFRKGRGLLAPFDAGP